MPALARIASRLVLAALLLVPSSAAAGPLTDQERDVALKHLAETRQKFLDSISTLNEAQWTFKPAPDRWSIAEVAEHIAISESTILQLIREKIMSAPPAPPEAARVPDEKVIAGVTDRSERFQAPEFLRPTNRWSTWEALVKDFIAARQTTVDYVKTTTDDMRAHAAPHPVLKTLDAYQWLLLVSAHTARHTAQIEEVKTSSGYTK
jgi:hypothetical protein